MERIRKSLGHQLALVALVAAGSLLFLGGGAVVYFRSGPGLLMVVLGVSTLCLAGATWLASTRLVSGPLLQLADDVRGLSAARDYSVRVASRSRNEVGLLVDCFNALLGEVQQREQSLQESLQEGDQHLETLEATLEERTAIHTRELHELNEKLEAATARATAVDRSRSEFVANITHELRTPMNGVFGMAELLLNTGLTPQQEKCTRAVMDSAEDLLRIVNNILDFSKVDAGVFEKIDNQPFSPKKSVDQVLDLLVGRAQQAGLALSHECDDDVPGAMVGDGKRLRQVLTNLVGNAIKFTKQGKIVVRTSLMEHGVSGSTVRFEVVDTGIGIPEYLHKDIFEGFSQVDKSTTRQFGGTGLGLAISKHLVTLMGGEIDVVSRPGVGSNFWFTIQGELSTSQRLPTWTSAAHVRSSSRSSVRTERHSRVSWSRVVVTASSWPAPKRRSRMVSRLLISR